jgi:CRP-like cAMP-binding protein
VAALAPSSPTRTAPVEVLAGLPGCRIMRVAAGRRVEGWEPGVTLVVVDGAVVVPTVCPSSARSAVEVLGPGDAFGFEPLAPSPPPGGGRLSGQPIHRQPAAPVRSCVLSVPRAVATRSFGDRGAAEALFDLAVAHARRVEGRLIRALTLPLVERLHAELVELSNTCGSPIPQGRQIDIPLTQDLMADLMGAARESVNRALRVLAGSGLVEHAGRRYVVRDPPAPP